MKVLIVGAGRMGIRHATGALKSSAKQVTLVDIFEGSLATAKQQLSGIPESEGKLETKLLADIGEAIFDVIIFATTAKNRLAQFRDMLKYKPAHVLFEKPLGQSYAEVCELVKEVNNSGVKDYVNLNMRMYDFIKQLKHDLQVFPQFDGIKSINFTGGALGISANGVHYLDLLCFLFEAASAEIAFGEIDEKIIPSGRGTEFGDYGGWAMIRFYDGTGNYLGKSMLSITAYSSAFGGWDIIGTNGRIRIQELEAERIDILRDPASSMPVHRYAADYLPPARSAIESPALSELTCQWIESLSSGTGVLPSLSESLLAHKLLFEWLDKGDAASRDFLIT